MLTELHVRDLGVISDVTVELGPGMTALTGETGAGKTLLVAALGLVLGGRATTGLVRAGAAEALVDARLERDAGTETILSRTIPASGRARAWVDGRMVPVGALADVGAGLVDIHGQHEQQTLLTVAGQRAALDQFAHADLAPLARARHALAEVTERLAALGGDARERARQLDLLRYQADEIDAAAIVDITEAARLEEEERRLADIGALRAAAASAAASVDADDATDAAAVSGAFQRGATSQLGDAVHALGGHAPLAEWEQRLRGTLAELSDVAAGLRQVVETWEDDPARLEEVQARRRFLSELRRKYGDTLEDVVAFGADARRAVAALEGQEVEAGALEAGRASAASTVATEEAALRKVRAGAAPALARAVTDRLRSLAMPDATLDVEVGEEGAGDAVVFLLAANRGEAAQPLSRVASGGELARTMLAVRLVVEGGAPTMLFDEVDAGVGGSAALSLARALHEVAATRQVLVVTHLPQVAAFADRQIAVRKVVDGARTVTAVEPLDTDGRVEELSRMLSGHPESATARAHAEELLLVARGSPASTTSVAARD